MQSIALDPWETRVGRRAGLRGETFAHHVDERVPQDTGATLWAQRREGLVGKMGLVGGRVGETQAQSSPGERLWGPECPL